jgi:L-ascorbate metabolism protein UlaG (beta-lactamase superfamily)
MSEARITHIGGPTTLIEAGDWRLLTDPTFDPPGHRYRFGWGTSSHKTAGPALTPAELPPIDAVLLSHDHHGDNLDLAGRALLASAETVLTTPSGASAATRAPSLPGRPTAWRLRADRPSRLRPPAERGEWRATGREPAHRRQR